MRRNRSLDAAVDDGKLPRPKGGVPVAAKSEEDERLRPGRVAVRGEQLIWVEAFLSSAAEAMGIMKKQLITAKLPVPPVPEIAALGSVWRVYADRARRSLAAFGINAAV